MFGEDTDLSGMDDDVGGEDTGGEQLSQQEAEQEARALGWVPQDKFRGNKDKWVDAAEFLERGEKLLPLLKANNQRLQRELLQRDQKLGTMQQQLDAATASMARLEEHYTAANKRLVQDSITGLKQELTQAREDNDVDKEVELLAKIQELTTAVNAPAPTKTTTPDDANKGLTPEFIAWKKENSWYDQDKKRTKAINRIAEDLREDEPELKGREFMDRCLELLVEQEGGNDGDEPPVRKPSKVGTPTPSARSTSSQVKGWANLPKDAQQACLSDADTLVGEGKRYKTLDDWKKKYVAIYFGE